MLKLNFINDSIISNLKRFLLLNIILISLIYGNMAGQMGYEKEQVTFGIKQWDPVHIKVDEKNRNSNTPMITFFGSNSTYYPFVIKIKFTVLENLAPNQSEREQLIKHGATNLFTLSPKVLNKSYGFQYSYNYWLKPSDEEANEKFPYLIPIKEGKTVVGKQMSFGSISDSFILNKGDTVYCMRRGLVTAAPATETPYFRLSEHDCVEILHDDGTYLIYRYLDWRKVPVAPGTIVLPGQPVGFASDSGYVLVSLYKIVAPSNILQAQQINYAVGNGDPVTYTDINGTSVSIHPPEIIIREMKKGEIRKMKNDGK